ncbi:MULTISPECIES: four helix bundle protein [Larkinella]|uniref:Four helix bundle protein n=1 Tax=Larkinella humicola TaxID=2607654 RepID=A0A5N1JPC1_9BACT|nr:MULTISPECIES: four helix bundle protein [Larkinella]KAA9357317.1 four helix bundle protein [Larkinella humicola]
MEPIRIDKGEFADSVEKRLKGFMLRCVQVFRSLPNSFEAQHFGKQLLRSSSSSAANYRAVRRARSQNEFFAKISIVVEELDESLFWLETLIDTEIVTEIRLSDLLSEGVQLVKMLSKSRNSVKK